MPMSRGKGGYVRFLTLILAPLLGCVIDAKGSDDRGTPGELRSMIEPCEVGTIADIAMPPGALVIAVLNVQAIKPSDGGASFDLTKPALQWAQSTGRFLNVTCAEPEILIFYQYP